MFGSLVQQKSKSERLAVQPGIADDPWVLALRKSYAELLPRSGASVLLAVSGGTDSAALLFGTWGLAEHLSLRLEVASLDHGLRRESADEVAGVGRWCQELALPFHSRLLPVGSAGTSGLEARGRVLRYEALERIRLTRGLDWVATAHTASDQAETLLMRLARGIALRGARSIAPRRGKLLRPMLKLSREQAVPFLDRIGRQPFEDLTNADGRWLRSRVRHRLLPRFAEVTALEPGTLAQRLAHFCFLAAEDEAYLEQQADRAYRALSLENGRLDAVGVRSLERPLRRRVLIRLLEEAGFQPDGDLIERVDTAVLGSKRATLPARRCLETSGGVVTIWGE